MSRSYKVRNPDGIYFITFATIGWIDVFTRRMYNELIVENLKYCQNYKGLRLFAWCLMTNHMHLVCKSNGLQGLPEIMRDFKKYTSKRMIRAIQENPKESRKAWMLSIFKRAGEYNSNNTYFQFWRQDYHPIEVYSNWVINIKINYIHMNPVKAGMVDEPEHYIYSSARNYAGMQGRLEIELL